MFNDAAPSAFLKRVCCIPVWSWSILLSAFAWTVLTVAVSPARQEFPLGDDWAFSRGAIWFAQGQGIHYSLWASMPQLGQWLWSVPFLTLGGPSLFALRLSTIVLSWLGMASFFGLLRQEGVPPRIAGFASCLLAANPLFFVSQGTYMTDVPALSLGLIALFCYGRAIAARNHRWLGVAVVAALLGVITRQTLVLVPLAAGLTLARLPELRIKPVWILAVVVPVIACWETDVWFSQRPDVNPMQMALPNLETTALRLFIAVHLCGLTVLPLGLLLPRPRSWTSFSLALLLMLLAACFLYFHAKPLPYGGLFPYTTGMLSLCGTYSEFLVAGTREHILTPMLRIGLTVLGCIGGAVVAARVVDAGRTRKLPGLLMLFTLLQAGVLLAMPKIYDRYFEVLFPGALCLLAVKGAESRLRWLAGTALLIVYGWISVGLMHDWLAWNAARWELGRQALAQGIAPTDIEGGFEWNGWYACADPNHSRLEPAPQPRLGEGISLSLPFTQRRFPRVTGQDALAFTQPTNSLVIASKPYTQWLGPSPKDFLFVGQLGLKGESRP